MYAKITDNAVSKYPYSFNDLKKDNPNVSFPSNALADATIRAAYGIEPVVAVASGTKKGFIYTEATPVKVGSEWKQAWTETAKNKADLATDEVEAVSEPTATGKKAVEGDPALDGGVWKQTWTLVDKTWLENRQDAYGTIFEQMEYITENGLDAWQTKVAEIKAKYPKS